MNASIPISCLVALGIDETLAEQEHRLRREPRTQPADHDAHVMAWRVFVWEWIEEIAWQRRQERALMEDYL